MKKRMLSVLTVFVLLFSLCAVPARAAGDAAGRFGNLEEVAAEVREYLKVRAETFTVRLNYVPTGTDMDAITQEIMDAIEKLFELATVHTGDPREGDSIRNQWDSMPMEWEGAPGAGGYNIVLTFSPGYFSNAEQQQELDRAVDELLKDLKLDGKSDYEKIRIIYDYICNHVSYDYDNMADYSNTLKNTAYAALINEKAVCYGYATLFYRLALEAGIDARVILGTSKGQTHSWNLVELDGRYYHVDTTWDSHMAADNLPYQCFLKSDAGMPGHTRTGEFAAEEFYDAYPMAAEDYSPSDSVEPTEPDPTEPESTEPEPTEPEPTEPEPTEPEPTEPEPTEPEPTEPEPTEPEPTEPEPTEPEPTEPEPTEPEPTEPEPTEPEPTEPMENPFTDVKETDYFYNPVLWAVSNGITSGMGPDQFGPARPCTRAQVVTFLWRAAGAPEPMAYDNPFTDVTDTDYYFRAVLWAVEQGITSGMSETMFGSSRPCTRAQVVTFLWRAAGSPEPEGVNPFTDVAETDYFFKPVLYALENGITSGMSDTLFGSTHTCTRAHVVTFLYQSLKQ